MVLLTNTGNSADKGRIATDSLPQYLMNPGIYGLMVVGATDLNGRRASTSEVFKGGTPVLYAPRLRRKHRRASRRRWLVYMCGWDIVLHSDAWGSRSLYPWPPQVKAMIQQLSRELESNSPDITYDVEHPEGERVAFAWNGQVRDQSCFVDGTLADANGAFLCPESFRDCSSLSSTTKDKRDDTCPLPSSAPGGSSGGGTEASTPITWSWGVPSPTCTSGCGVLYTGYYCVPNPTPNFSDPVLRPKTTTTVTTQPVTTVTVTSITSSVAVTPTPYYDCEGATLCTTTNVKWCDEAVCNMDRGSKIYTASDTIAVAGNCWAIYEGFGCSVQIRGSDDGAACQITGDDMWNAYQNIRDLGDCSTCGSKHLGNGVWCLLTITMGVTIAIQGRTGRMSRIWLKEPSEEIQSSSHEVAHGSRFEI